MGVEGGGCGDGLCFCLFGWFGSGWGVVVVWLVGGVFVLFCFVLFVCLFVCFVLFVSCLFGWLVWLGLVLFCFVLLFSRNESCFPRDAVYLSDWPVLRDEGRKSVLSAL